MVHFLSLNAKLMKEKMHPGLLRHLQQNNINVGADLESLNASQDQILGALTDVKRSKAEASNLLSGTFCLTGLKFPSCNFRFSLLLKAMGL